MVAHSTNSDDPKHHGESAAGDSRRVLDNIVKQAEVKPAAKADFADIERRASELAARLGGGIAVSAEKASAGMIGNKKTQETAGAGGELTPSTSLQENISASDWREVRGSFEPEETELAADTPELELEQEQNEPRIDISIHEEDLVMDDLEYVMKRRDEDIGQWQQDEREELGEIPTGNSANSETQEKTEVEPDLDAALLDVSQFINTRIASAGHEVRSDPTSEDSSSQDEAVMGVEVPDEETDQGMKRIAARIGEALDDDTAGASANQDLRDIEKQISVLTDALSEEEDMQADTEEEAASVPLSSDASPEGEERMQVDEAPHLPEEIAETCQAALVAEDADASVASGFDKTSSKTMIFEGGAAEALQFLGTGAAAGGAVVEATQQPAEVESRLDVLERQVIELVDELASSERRLQDVIAAGHTSNETAGSGPQDVEAVADSLAQMSAQIEKLERQQEAQEQHFSDSLDALHDALKEISERMSRQDDEIAAHTGVAAGSAVAGGIASSVMTSRLVDDGTTALAAPVEGAKVDPAPLAEFQQQEDILPIWLDDPMSRGDEIQEQIVLEQQADVFRSSAADDDHAKVPEHGLGYTYEAATEIPAQPTVATQSSYQGDVKVEEVAQDTSAQHIDIDEEASEWEQVSPAPGRSPEADSEAHDFLHQARAIAQASNERLIAEEADKNTRKNKISAETSSFIEAARNQDHQADVTPPVAAASKRKSLFSSDSDRPNLLFVFSTLILLGTSAMLLYGMVRNGDKAGSVSQINAVEAPATARPHSNAPAKAGKTGRKGEKHSTLKGKTSHRVASVGGQPLTTGSPATATAKTDYDKMVSDRLAAMHPVPAPYEITGAIPENSGSKKKDPAFEQYKGFVGDTVGGQSIFGSREVLPSAIGPLSLRTKASKGEMQAQYEIGRRYQEGYGVTKNVVKSLAWYRKASKAGYAPAMYRLATFHERGVGVSKDAKKAAELYLAAAAKGNVKAMHNLGVLYTSGNLGKPDFKKALRWYEKASKFGIKDSQFNAAIIYQNGMGVPVNEKRAYRWYLAAAANGDTEAGDIVRQMSSAIDAKTRSSLEKEAMQWKPLAANPHTNADKALSRTYGQAQAKKPVR